MLEEIKNIIHSIAPNAEVYLFGSRARKDARKDSDWDILVLLNEDGNLKLQEREIVNKLYDLEVEKEIAINPVVYAKKQWEGIMSASPLHQNIEEEGIKI